MDRPLRVLHIVDSLRGGGVEHWLWDAVRLADRSRIEHRVVTVASETDAWRFAEPLHAAGAYTRCVRRFGEGAGYAGRLLEATPRSFKQRLWSILGTDGAPAQFADGYGRIALEYMRFRPHLIHGHLFHGLRAGAWLKSWTGRPFVYAIWNRLAQLHEESAAWVADDYLRLHPVVDAFLTDPAYRPELIEHGLPAEKIYTFDAGIDFGRVDRFAFDVAQYRASIRRQLGIPDDAPLALSVGRLTESKGHHHALAAMSVALRHVPGLHWVLLGEGEQRASLTARAEGAGISSAVHMPGFVTEPFAYYAAADVFLRTWTLEGDNRASHDAMAFGLPVVGFDTACGNDRLPTVGHGLRVPNGDAAALADAAVRILLLPDRGRGLGARGREDARRHLGIDRMLEVITSQYERVTAVAA
jgi:glycosyltransferase involved in cell wall biosynthesis